MILPLPISQPSFLKPCFYSPNMPRYITSLYFWSQWALNSIFLALPIKQLFPFQNLQESFLLRIIWWSQPAMAPCVLLWMTHPAILGPTTSHHITCSCPPPERTHLIRVSIFYNLGYHQTHNHHSKNVYWMEWWMNHCVLTSPSLPLTENHLQTTKTSLSRCCDSVHPK